MVIFLIISCCFQLEMDYIGKDMEADLVEMYNVVRRRLAMMDGVNVEDFGPPKAITVDEENTQDDAVHQRLITQREIEGRQISHGYSRIKEKVR